MALQTETLFRIKAWIQSYRKHKQLPNETNSVTIDLKKIVDFLEYIKLKNTGLADGNPLKINAVRFYLTRQNDILDSGGNGRMPVFFDEEYKPQTQISLVGLPVVNYDLQTIANSPARDRLLNFNELTVHRQYKWWVGRDYRPEVDRVVCLYARDERSEHTGLCPYNCDENL